MPEYLKDFYLKLYREMLRIRLFEEALIEPILSGELKTPCHLYTGQEAIAVGVCQALRKKDHVYGNHRSHGHYIAKGGDMNALAAEIWGKKTGCSRGKGGSMHIIDIDCGFMGSTPITAGTVSIAVGDALAAKIQGDDRIVVSFFGDGAMGEGVVYEAINFAVINNLQIIFICENNGYAAHMPINKIINGESVQWKVNGFGIDNYEIDGNKILEVKNVLEIVTNQSRTEKKPFFIECQTYRLCGHVGPDDNILGEHGDIRPEKEVEEWKQRDPIKKMEEEMRSAALEERAAPLREEVKAEVNAAIEFARQSDWPDPVETWRGVYKEQYD